MTLHEKIERMAGNPHVHLTEHSPFEHCPHENSAMKRAEKHTKELITGDK